MDKSLPFFAYGALKTGQLAHKQIRDSAHSLGPATVQGYELIVVDGIARAVPLTGEFVYGELLELTPEGYSKVSKFEDVPKKYSWQQVVTDKGPANMLVNSIRDIKSRNDHVNSWTAVHDPFFAFGIPWTFDKLSALKMSGVGASSEREKQSAFLELQATYTILWSLFERLMLFQEGPLPKGKTLIHRIEEVNRSPEWSDAIEAASIDRQLGARSNSRPNGDAYRGLDGWHQKRNNIIHRGKSAIKEQTALLSAAIDMHNTLAIYMQQNSEEIRKFWINLTAVPEEPYSSWLYQIRR